MLSECNCIRDIRTLQTLHSPQQHNRLKIPLLPSRSFWNTNLVTVSADISRNTCLIWIEVSPVCVDLFHLSHVKNKFSPEPFLSFKVSTVVRKMRTPTNSSPRPPFLTCVWRLMSCVCKHFVKVAFPFSPITGIRALVLHDFYTLVRNWAVKPPKNRNPSPLLPRR